MKLITKEEANFIREQTKTPFITIVNKRGGAKRKRRYVAMTSEVCKALAQYQAKRNFRMIERHGE